MCRLPAILPHGQPLRIHPIVLALPVQVQTHHGGKDALLLPLHQLGALLY